MSKIRKYPTSGVRSGRVLFRYNEIKLYPRAELHIFSKQHYSQLQVYGRRNLVSGTPSPHINTDTYLQIHWYKKIILASIYPKEMLIVLAMLLSFNKSISLPRFLPRLQKQPEASPLRAARSLQSRPGSMWYGDS